MINSEWYEVSPEFTATLHSPQALSREGWLTEMNGRNSAFYGSSTASVII